MSDVTTVDLTHLAKRLDAGDVIRELAKLKDKANQVSTFTLRGDQYDTLVDDFNKNIGPIIRTMGDDDYYLYTYMGRDIEVMEIGR